MSASPNRFSPEQVEVTDRGNFPDHYWSQMPDDQLRLLAVVPLDDKDAWSRYNFNTLQLFRAENPLHVTIASFSASAVIPGHLSPSSSLGGTASSLLKT